jgi:glutaredoxin
VDAMKKFQVITKKGCPKCDQLKAWLKSKNAAYEEWKIEDEEVKHKLLHDQKFIQTFCDIEGCVVYTPVIRLDESGTYYFKELFDMTGIRQKYVTQLLEL